MSGTFFEQFRQRFEDIETIEKAIAAILYDKSKNSKNMSSLSYDLAIRYLIDKASVLAQQTAADIDDVDGLKKDELSLLGGNNVSTKNAVWNNFYARVSQVTSHERKYPSDPPSNVLPKVLVEEAYKSVTKGMTASRFSAPERNGRVLDLSEQYNMFINLDKYREWRAEQFRLEVTAKLVKQAKRRKLNPDEEGDDGEKQPESTEDNEALSLDFADPAIQKKLEFTEIDFISWIKSFDELIATMPRALKFNNEPYMAYLRSLNSYLRGFLLRSRPLARVEEAESKFEEEFDAQWKQQLTSDASSNWALAGGLTCRDKLYVWETDTLCTSEAHLQRHKDSKKFKAASKSYLAEGVDAARARLEAACTERDRELAKLEAGVARWRALLGETVDATVAHLQRVQALGPDGDIQDDSEGGDVAAQNVGAIEAEAEEEERAAMAEQATGGSGGIYNPLNIPLGFDGKPIPYWLWKLNGLGHSFNCEICGNFTYWGAQNFQRHFNEWRHAQGMRCLKIPNTPHFRDVTKIADAVKLHAELTAKGAHLAAANAIEEEVEDAHGNLMTRELLDDLRRQGLA